MYSNYHTLVDVVIKAEMAGAPRHELVLMVCETPQHLVDVGFQPLPLAVKAKTVGKMHYDHGMTQRQIQQLPQILASPSALFLSASRPDSVVVLTYEIKAGKPIIVPVAKDRRLGRDMLANEVSSMYAKDGPDVIVRWRKDGLLLWEAGSTQGSQK